MWKICELSIIKKLSEEFNVSTVPIIWLYEENETLFCYWPKTNTKRKIRTCAVPNKWDPNWKSYKCRLLMRGRTFTTYSEAIEAEKISQNYSTLTEYNELEGENTDAIKVNDLKNVKMVNLDDKDRSLEVDKHLNFSTSDVDTDDEQCIGNDSFEFNEGIKCGGTYMSKVGDSSKDADKQRKEKNQKNFFDRKYSSSSDEETDFNINLNKLNKDGFFTSTLLDDVESPQGSEVGIKRNLNHTYITNGAGDRVQSQISKIETSVSSFMNDIQQDLQFLKELVAEDAMGDKVPLNAQLISVENLEVTGRNENTDVPKFAAHRVEILNNDILELPFGEDDIAPPEIRYQNIEAMDCDQFASDSLMELPIANDIFYEKVEDKLILEEDAEEKPFEDNLSELLATFNGEPEAKYMDRTALTIFKDNFFLNQTSWKKMNGRVDMTGSRILKVWQKCYSTMYGPDNADSSKFKAHFRRFKSALRAAAKGKTKTTQSGNRMKK